MREHGLPQIWTFDGKRAAGVTDMALGATAINAATIPPSAMSPDTSCMMWPQTQCTRPCQHVRLVHRLHLPGGVGSSAP